MATVQEEFPWSFPRVSSVSKKGSTICEDKKVVNRHTLVLKHVSHVLVLRIFGFCILSSCYTDFFFHTTCIAKRRTCDAHIVEIGFFFNKLTLHLQQHQSKWMTNTIIISLNLNNSYYNYIIILIYNYSQALQGFPVTYLKSQLSVVFGCSKLYIEMH